MSDWRSRAVPVEPEPSAEEQPKSDWRSRAQAVEPSATPAQDVARERYGFDASRPQTLNRYAVLKPGAGMRDKLESAAAPYEQTARRMLRRGGTAYLGRKADAAIEGVKDASEQPGFFDEVIRFLAPGVPVGGSSRALKRGGEAFAKGYERRYDEEKVKDEAVREANPTAAGILETAGLAAPLAPVAAGLGAAGLSPLAAGGVMGAGLAGAASEATDPLSFLLDAGQGGLAGGLGAAAPWVGAGMMTVPAVAGEQMGMSPADVASARAGLATSLVSGGKAALGSAKRTKAAGKRDEAIERATEAPRTQLAKTEEKINKIGSVDYSNFLKRGGIEPKAPKTAEEKIQSKLAEIEQAEAKLPIAERNKAAREHQRRLTVHGSARGMVPPEKMAPEARAAWEAIEAQKDKSTNRVYTEFGEKTPEQLAAEHVANKRAKIEARRAALLKQRQEVAAGPKPVDPQKAYEWQKAHQRDVPAFAEFDPTILYPPVEGARFTDPKHEAARRLLEVDREALARKASPEFVIKKGEAEIDAPVVSESWLDKVPVVGGGKLSAAREIGRLFREKKTLSSPEAQAAFYDRLAKKLQTSPERWGKFQRFVNTLVLSRPGPEGLANLLFAAEKDPELAAAVEEAAREAP